MLLYFDNQVNFIPILSLICFPLMPQSTSIEVFSLTATATFAKNCRCVFVCGFFR